MCRKIYFQINILTLLSLINFKWIIFAQIIEDKKNSESLHAAHRFHDNRAAPIEIAVSRLTDSITQLSDKLTGLEKNLGNKLKRLEESFNQEKQSMESLSSRLDILDTLTGKINDLDTKLEEETSVMRMAISATTQDVQHLATQLEELEETHPDKDIRGSKTQSKKNAANKPKSEEGKRQDPKNVSSKDNEQKNEEDLVIARIEKVLPRLLAAELNHFYLNMASKLDHSVGQLQREMVLRLRRIESTTKESLTEIQETRQDISHLTHLQRASAYNASFRHNHAAEESAEKSSGCLNNILGNVALVDLMKEMNQNVSADVILAVTKFHQNLSHQETAGGQLNRQNGQMVAQTSQSNTDIWKGIFSGGLKDSASSKTVSALPSKHCLDQTSFATLDEVKQLLRTLVSKGEDLRRALTKQASEGVDLLKLLHQRFSVLLRRMNTDPGHGEALLAEIQELEHLVQNSYSSILLAQNVFIESCHRIQQEQPTIEGKIVTILNKLVTNIDLGHQSNRKQLEEVRKLIEQMTLDDQTKDIPYIPTWLTSDTTANNFVPSREHPEETPIFKGKFFNNLINAVAEANNTEDKLQNTIDRISDVEEDLQGMNWNTADVKNTIDELLTAAKDLKGYSRSQIRSLQNMQEGFLGLVGEYTEFKRSLIPRSNNTKPISKIWANENSNSNYRMADFQISEECATAVLHQLKSMDLKKVFSNASDEMYLHIFKYIFPHITDRKTENDTELFINSDTIPSLKSYYDEEVSDLDGHIEKGIIASKDYTEDYLQDHYNNNNNYGEKTISKSVLLQKLLLRSPAEVHERLENFEKPENETNKMTLLENDIWN